MIKIRKYSNLGQSEGINISPLIDMVFILLIFFVVTTSFIKETGVEVSKPNAKTSHTLKKGNILIAVTKQENIYFDNKQVELLAVSAIVQQGLKEIPNAGVIIIADKNVKTGLVVKIIDQCKLAGAECISIASENN